MDDVDTEGHQNGRPRRHDGKDPWSFVTRARVVAELAHETSADLSVVPGAPQAGDVVSVIIERERHDAQGRFEEIWLDVEAVDGDAIVARLDSQPTYVRGVAAGDQVRLTQEQILSLRRPR